MVTTLSNEALLEHVKGALMACYKAVTIKGAEARAKVETTFDIKTVGDLTARQALVEYFKESGLPLVLYTEELEQPVMFSPEPAYSAVGDEIDGTYNFHRGMGMLPCGSVVGIAATPRPSFEDVVAAGFLEFNSGNLFYAVKGGGSYLIEGWARGSKAQKRVRTSGTTSLQNAGLIVPDSYMLGTLAPFFSLDAAKGSGDYRCTGAHLALIASGSIDLFIFASNCMNPNKLRTVEEIGPLYLLVKEAGGTILDWNGNDLGPEEIGLDRKRTFHGIAAATGQLGREYLQERMMKIPEIKKYVEMNP